MSINSNASSNANLKRRAIFVVNRNRQEAIDAESKLKSLLSDFEFVEDDSAEIVIVLGGDGTILRGAVVARRLNVPLLGINLGRVGFMAEVEKSTFEEIAIAIREKSYSVEPRLVLEYEIERGGKKVGSGWALNEVTIECEQGTMIELLLQIDGRPISSWWADGLIVATPTGSTAYAFSVGGPIIWPQTDALVVTPIAAHALFTRPLVIPPTSDIAIDILSEDGVVKADALRFEGLLVGDRVLVNRANEFIQLAHVRPTSFSDRLVAKFKLPIEGWRGE